VTAEVHAGRTSPAPSRRSRVFDTALALLATGAELALLLDDGTASLAALLLTILGGGALVLRRRRPLAVLAATLAAAIAIVAVGEAPAGITVLIALFSTAVVCDRTVSLAALPPTAAVLTVLSIVTAEEGTHPSSVLIGAVVAAPLAAGIWALGAYAQTRRHYTWALEERAAQLEREREQLARIAIQEERTAIARELHDIVAHSVSVMLLGVRGARDVMHRSPVIAEDTLARAERSGEQSLHELRRMLAVLRAPQHGAESRPQPSLADLGELVSGYRSAGVSVALEVTGRPPSMPAGLELSVYRIVQEALTNAIKHAAPSRVTVSLAVRGTCLDVEVVDDGASAAPGAAPADSGHGIIGMRERVALLGGQFEAGRRSGGGFRVAARVPLGGHG
jgi:signal transduction histidine kinase